MNIRAATQISDQADALRPSGRDARVDCVPAVADPAVISDSSTVSGTRASVAA